MLSCNWLKRFFRGSGKEKERRRNREGRERDRENTFEALFYTVGLQLDKMIYLFVCLGTGDSTFQGMFVKDYEAEFMCVELAEIWEMGWEYFFFLFNNSIFSYTIHIYNRSNILKIYYNGQ